MATDDDGWPLKTNDVSEGGGGSGDLIDKFWVKRKMVYEK